MWHKMNWMVLGAAAFSLLLMGLPELGDLAMLAGVALMGLLGWSRQRLTCATGRTLLLLVLTSLGNSALAAPSNYSVTNLGVLPGREWSEAWGINDAGQVVVRSWTGNEWGGEDEGVFRWENGATTEPDSSFYLYSVSGRINNLGYIPGYQLSSDVDIYGETVGHACVWDGSTLRDIHPSTLLGSSYATAINDADHVVGEFYSLDYNTTYPFVFDGSSMQEISFSGGRPEGWCETNDINNSGQVVGYVQQNVAYAFVVEAPGQLARSLDTLLGGTSSAANAINDAGTIIGDADVTGGQYHAVVWDATTRAIADLGTLPGRTASTAVAINDLGQIVGNSSNRVWTEGGGYAFLDQHACLWDNSQLFDLNDFIASDSGWDLRRARGINDLGQIVGWGDYNGDHRAFLLTPLSEPVFLPGDADKSGTVDVADLTNLLNNYNKTGMVWANGDFNNDGTVNVVDLTALLNNYNQTSGLSMGMPVPEPSSLAMLAGVALALLLCCWRKRA
jgi:probable HAF family extracellular repeat protein